MHAPKPSERLCHHCDPSSDAFADLLRETEEFRIVCDHHPLTEGHILIIPKRHVSCVGAFPEALFREFLEHYDVVSAFVREHYGSVSTFEHGVIGQTVFHAHVHVLPFIGDPPAIVPEGAHRCTPISSLAEVRTHYQREGKYLFFSIGDHRWIVDTALGAPRFFRDRFAAALDASERGNWKTMHENRELMAAAAKENTAVKHRWNTDRPG